MPSPLLPTTGPSRNDALPQSLTTEYAPATQLASGPPPAAPAQTPPPLLNLSMSTFAGSGRATPGQPPVTLKPGDEFFGFRLVELLGQGTFAKVYLAKQEALANREVALKVTFRPTREAERLARLQHTNIVPVYSVHAAGSAQLICMPYLGRRTLGDLLVGHRSLVSAGQSTRKALHTRKGSSYVAGSRSRTATRTPTRPQPAPAAATPADPAAAPLVGQVQPVLRVLAQLADGLAHAHGRGVLHLDIKPANVLLADTGEPMLLDFNLSFDAAEKDREVVGGTIPYMSPEQLLDMRSRGQGKVDARTDLYALGVVAFELLTGNHPFPTPSRTLADFEKLSAAREAGPPSLREMNPEVTPAVEAIVRKLLAPAPADRYQTAAELKDDLDRQLADRPLRFAADKSVVERVGKWRRRNPRALVAMLLALAVAGAGGTGAWAYQKSEALADSAGADRARRAREGMETTRLDLLLPNDPAARARGTKAALATLREFGLPDDPRWREKAAFARVPKADQPAAAADLGELLLLLAHARWQDGKGSEPEAAAADALRLNQSAEGCFGENAPPFLARQRADLTAAVNGTAVEQPAAAAATTPRDHFLDGIGRMAEGNYVTAGRSLEKTIAAQPNHGAAHFFLAYCRQQSARYERAAERYDAAQSLLPTDPRPALYRAMALGLHGKDEAAEEALTKALDIDPASADAYRNRAVARVVLGKLKGAEADLTAALEHGASPAQVYAARVKVRDRLGDEAGAAADRKAFAACRPARDLDYLTLGMVRLHSDPKGALADFRAAEKLNPQSLPALLNQIHTLSDVLGDNDVALRITDRMVGLYPEYGPARAARAVVLARLGRRDDAHREVELSRRLTEDPRVTYRLACVYAMTSKTHPADRPRALAMLREAFRAGFHDLKSFEKDAYLDPLRKTPEFDLLLKAVRELAL